MVIGMAITGSMLCHKNPLKFMQLIQVRVFLSNDQKRFDWANLQIGNDTHLRKKGRT